MVPQGAGTITASRTSTCTATTSSPSVLTKRGEDAVSLPSDEPVVAVNPAASAQRSRAFAALTAKAQAEGRVRVIVGLRSEGGSEASAASNFKDAAARAAMVGRVDRVQQALMVRMSSHNLSSVRRFKYIPFLAMEVDASALEALASDPEVVSIEEDKLLKPMLEESVPLVEAPQAWSQGFSGAGQTIAILDDGVDKDHPFLRGKVVSEACYSGGGSGESLCPGGVTESTSPGSGMPCSDPEVPNCLHGTHVAGIAAGRGPKFSGVARDASLISIQVFSRFDSDDRARLWIPQSGWNFRGRSPCRRRLGRAQVQGAQRLGRAGAVRFEEHGCLHHRLAEQHREIPHPGRCRRGRPGVSTAVHLYLRDQPDADGKSELGVSFQELAGVRFRVRQPLHRPGELRRKRDRPLRIGCRPGAAPASLSVNRHAPGAAPHPAQLER